MTSNDSTSMPSSAYVVFSVSNTWSLNNFCSFSLAKLMHSCSSEFFLPKISNPKMSRIPTNA